MWTYNYPNTLYHHGIRGMKWGVRNGPPYPLNASAHSASEKKAGWRKSLDKSSKSSDTEDRKSKKFTLSDKQKRAIKIGAVTAGVILASYGTYRLYKSGRLDGLIKNGRNKSHELLTGTFDDGTLLGKQKVDIQNRLGKFKKLASSESVEDVISKVNPTGEHNNCYNVVTATTARLCGIDVRAKGDSQGGKGIYFEDVCKVFKLDSEEIKTMHKPDVDKLSRYIGRKYKEGDIGAIGLSWNDAYKQLRLEKWGIPVDKPAGHTLNWIIKNGKVLFVDGQGTTLDQRTRNSLETFLDSGKEVSIAKFANRLAGLNLETDIDMELFRRMVD